MSDAPPPTPAGAARPVAPADPPRRWWHALAVLPVLAILAAPFVANAETPRLLGLPFLLAWLVGWVLAASAIMALIHVLDERGTP